MYYPNMLVMGDCNLEFKRDDISRTAIDQILKDINRKELEEPGNALLNFPFLDVHPNQTELFKTAARQKETYDQIALVARDGRLPDHTHNEHAGTTGNPDDYDYGVFNFVNVFSKALHGKVYKGLTNAQKVGIIARCEYDVSDHMPIWIRLPKPF